MCPASRRGMPTNRQKHLSRVEPKPRTSGKQLRLGFIPLVDAAPLLAARELGLFARHGLNVSLSREVGWATVKEKMFYGELDGAHAPAGMAFAMKLGLQSLPCEVMTSFVLNLNGNAITLSSSMWKKGVRDAQGLRQLILSHRSERLVFGTVSLVSSHHFLLRRWLLSAGINPDRDVRIAVIPPGQMAANLKAGLLAGYCVGEPWNSAAVVHGHGWCPATSLDLAEGHVEKVLLLRSEYPARHPDEHAALLAALSEACAFCDAPANREEVIRILEQSCFKGMKEALLNSLAGGFDRGGTGLKTEENLHSFYRNQTNRPTFAKAAWVLEELKAARLLPQDFKEFRALATSVFREDLYEKAMKNLPESKPSRKPLLVRA